jgi:hypothetical protein
VAEVHSMPTGKRSLDDLATHCFGHMGRKVVQSCVFCLNMGWALYACASVIKGRDSRWLGCYSSVMTQSALSTPCVCALQGIDSIRQHFGRCPLICCGHHRAAGCRAVPKLHAGGHHLFWHTVSQITTALLPFSMEAGTAWQWRLTQSPALQTHCAAGTQPSSLSNSISDQRLLRYRICWCDCSY